jgi:hypothetical protein
MDVPGTTASVKRDAQNIREHTWNDTLFTILMADDDEDD